jgi:glutamine amidotransferase-like uncharacterized protein
MQDILVYQDYVHNNGVLLRRLRETYGAGRVGYCDASDILEGRLDGEITCFIMPGGADLYYCEKLSGAGNARIRAYVEQGGTYFGICAGAYYACRRIEWAKDESEHSICGDRELGFFKGTAIGPVYDLIENRNFSGSWNNVAMLNVGEVLCPAFYAGGPVFVPDDDSAYTTLATYNLPGAPAAFVEAPFGQGRAILSACHIEFTPELLKSATYDHRNPSPEWNHAGAHKFSNLWTPETDIWSKIISRLMGVA